MADADILMRVRGRNETTGVFREVEGQLNSLDKAAGAAAGGLQGIAGAVAGGFAVAQIAEMGIELTKVGAAALRVEGAFKQLATSQGANADAMLAALRRASLGTIDDTNLMLNANRAMMLGVTSNADVMAQLLEKAAARGRAMGRSTADAFSDIVTGIGRMSPLILDNLGIVTGGEAAFKAYAESLGKTADQLTDVEKKQMLVNKVLSDMTPLTVDAQTKIERLGAAWQNLRESVGKEFAMRVDLLGVPEFLQKQADLIEARRKIEEAFRQTGLNDLQAQVGIVSDGKAQFPLIPDAALRAQREALEAVVLQYQAGKLSLEEFTARVNAGVSALATYTQQSRDAATALAFLNERHSVLNPQMSAAEALAARLGQQYLVTGGNAQAAAAGVATLGNAVIAISGKFLTAADRARAFGDAVLGLAQSGASELLGVAGTMAAKTGADAAYDAYLQWTKGLEQAILAGKAEGKTLDELTLVKAAYIAKTREGINTIGQENRAMTDYNQTLDTLRGTIDGLISSAVGGTKSLQDFSPTSGFDPNGPARDFGRMWDVAKNGFQSQWLDELRSQGLIPDDVIAQGEAALKQFAESKARAFQAGTDLSLLDKGQLAAQVRQQIAAQAEMKRVREQILADVMQDPKISKTAASEALDTVLGKKGLDASAQGAQAGPSFSQSFTASLAGFGNKIADTLKTEIKAQEKAMQSAGEMAGQMWGGFFLGKVRENVPVELILILAALVTPEVLARIKATQARSGGAQP